MIIYTVQENETLVDIAAKYGIDQQILSELNGLSSDSVLSNGQSLIISYPKIVHTVRAGESLWSIAANYGVTVIDLWRNNPYLNGSSRIFTGQTLVVQFDEVKIGHFNVTAYVYTFVNREILSRSLPYLSFLAIFSYGIRSDGSLVTPENTGFPNDMELVSLAREYGVQPMMVLTSLNDSGSFSTETVSAVLSNEAAKSRLIANIIDTMAAKGYDALNADFEYIAPDDREKYSNFINLLASELHNYGYLLDISLAPKTSAAQTGLLYEAIDYHALGAAADTAFLMTYEWGYKYSEPRAVAPINLVEQVVNYALSEIPAQKLLLGMPNYGYDWEIPWQKGQPARTISNQEAVLLANEYSSTIMYDSLAASPYFVYSDENGSHEVWFEDARSVNEKLALASRKKLRGIGIWNATEWFPQLWALVNLLYYIR